MMKKKRKYIWNAIFLMLIIWILFHLVRGFYYYNQYKPHLLVKKDGENTLLMSSGNEIVLQGLIGSVELSEDEASVIYLRRAGGLGANIEVVEMDLETRDVKILVTVNELNTVIRNISPKKRIVHPELEERIRSVKYVPDTN